MTRATFGRTSPKQFAEFDPDTSSWKTWPAIGLWGSTPYSQSWPRTGMTRSGSASELPTSARLMVGNGSSSLLSTPTAAIATGSAPQDSKGKRDLRLDVPLLPTPEAKLSDSGPDYARADRDGSGGDDLMTTLAKLLPTPSASPSGSNQSPSPGAAVRPSLETLAPTLLPTPRATDAEKGSPNQRGSSGDMMLTGAIHSLLPTPTSRDHKGQNQRGDASCLTGALLPTPTTTQRGPDSNLEDRPEAGPNLHNSVMSLLPTPTAMDSEASGGSAAKDVTLTDAMARGKGPTGGSTKRRSRAGRTPLDEPLQLPLNLDLEAD